jgi:hypothetical protein
LGATPVPVSAAIEHPLSYDSHADRSAPVYWAVMQLASLAAVPLMVAFQRDRKPSRWLKYGFYLFYPLHILALCALRMALLGPLP